jgi:hypothetical protein
MAANEDWVPRTWGGRREQIAAIKAKVGEFGPELDLDAAAVTEVEQRCAGALAAIDYFDLSKGVQNGVSDWRESALLTGPEAGAMSGPPVNDAFVVPTGAITGFYKWLRKERDRWVKAAGYSTAIGEALQIATPHPEAPSNPKVELECQTALSGNFDFSAVIANRGESDACDLLACVVGTTNYQLLVTFTGKAVTGHWPDGTTAPVQLMVKAQLKRKNQNYGVPSDPFIVTVIP